MQTDAELAQQWLVAMRAIRQILRSSGMAKSDQMGVLQAELAQMIADLDPALQAEVTAAVVKAIPLSVNCLLRPLSTPH